MDDLINKRCRACELGVGKLSHDEVVAFMKNFSEWKNIDNIKISSKFTFPDFKSALKFVNDIGNIAETEEHHPDIKLGWGYVEISLTTHAVEGLSENDFIMAAKIDSINK